MSQPAAGIEITEPEPQCGWVPLLLQSQMPENPVKELVFTTPSPDDLVPLPPNTKNLIDKIARDDRENEAMAKAVEEKLYVPILPLVS